MKLFKTTKGFIFAFGFDVQERRANDYMIAWNDPSTLSWDPTAQNLAGTVVADYVVSPEFVFEARESVIAYQPGKCLVFTYIGHPYIWSFQTLLPDEAVRLTGVAA